MILTFPGGPVSTTTFRTDDAPTATTHSPWLEDESEPVTERDPALMDTVPVATEE